MRPVIITTLLLVLAGLLAAYVSALLEGAYAFMAACAAVMAEMLALGLIASDSYSEGVIDGRAGEDGE